MLTAVFYDAVSSIGERRRVIDGKVSSSFPKVVGWKEKNCFSIKIFDIQRTLQNFCLFQAFPLLEMCKKAFFYSPHSQLKNGQHDSQEAMTNTNTKKIGSMLKNLIRKQLRGPRQ